MGWLDIVLLAVVAVAGLGGLRLGLIRAVFVIAGMLIGWLVAGQLSDDIGAAVGGSSTTLDTVVTTVSYSVIVSACGAAAAFAGAAAAVPSAAFAAPGAAASAFAGASGGVPPGAGCSAALSADGGVLFSSAIVFCPIAIGAEGRWRAALPALGHAAAHQ